MRPLRSKSLRWTTLTALLFFGAALSTPAHAAPASEPLGCDIPSSPAACELLSASCGEARLDALIEQPADAVIACTCKLRIELRSHKLSCATEADQRRILRRFERALRKQGQTLRDAIAADEKATADKKAATKISPQSAQTGDTIGQTDSRNDTLKKIKAVVHVTEKGDLMIPAEDYDDIFFKLYTGYEFVAIDNFLGKGAPRISLLVNSLLGGDKVSDDVAGLGNYGGRITFAAALESTQEVTVTLPINTNTGASITSPTGSKVETDPTNPPSSSTTLPGNTTVHKAFGFELQGTWIGWRSRALTPDDLHNYLGLIVAAGGLKTDALQQVTGRFYGGLRWAKSPEFYADFMYGRTTDLRSRRLEVRGQFPVYPLDSGDRIYLGGIGNFGIDEKKHQGVDANGKGPIEEKDVVVVYVSWATDIKRLFSGSKSSN